MDTLTHTPPSSDRVVNLSNWLTTPIDNSSLILFRVAFGFLIAAEGFGAILTGWVGRTYVEPAFTFNFIGLDFLQILLGETMYAVYGLMGVAGVMVMLGYRYRLAMLTYAVLWSASYLLQKTSYNNHYYLLMLLCWVMALMPAHRYYSLDVQQNRVAKSLTCPRWCTVVFVVQLFIVYTFASLAKIYPDWLAGIPVGLWFGGKADFWLIGPLLQQEWLQTMVVYGGIAFDGLIIPALLWRKTRPWAFAIGVFFHGFNSAVFHIGIFPYLAIALCVFFFPPTQVRQVFFKRKPSVTSEVVTQTNYSLPTWIMALGIIYFAWQVYLPLRHYLYEGNVFWTEEGHRLSWRMMLRTKAGSVRFMVEDKATGEIWWEEPRDHLTSKQSRKLATHPDMIWQFSQYLEKTYQEKGYADVAIYAHGKVSLNGHKRAPLVDSSVDLADVSWQPFRHATWIYPDRNLPE
ncbi:HTTM domain-containing protein [Tunicatimonas pelagia]|uniref:HTTM domain-containing protein n=1 Tax=Tunicatimonas pelagia TaxID=931531 RepID=UPI00266600C0|nr:HTTM domain-containing protein [Tunicatimonas pelagia]WKN44679.1 HTTM domain-containing protein [Tunicatimonas pelagia]